jgi:hypothetical protein
LKDDPVKWAAHLEADRKRKQAENAENA